MLEMRWKEKEDDFDGADNVWLFSLNASPAQMFEQNVENRDT